MWEISFSSITLTRWLTYMALVEQYPHIAKKPLTASLWTGTSSTLEWMALTPWLLTTSIVFQISIFTLNCSIFIRTSHDVKKRKINAAVNAIFVSFHRLCRTHRTCFIRRVLWKQWYFPIIWILWHEHVMLSANPATTTVFEWNFEIYLLWWGVGSMQQWSVRWQR